MKKILLPLLFLSKLAMAQIPATGQLAYFPFDGNSLDASGNDVSISSVNAVLTADRNLEEQKAYLFSGTNSKMIIPFVEHPDLRLTYNFTMAAWIKPETGFGLYPTIFEFGDKLFFRMVGNNNNRLEAGYYNGSTWRTVATGNNVIRADEWVHVAFTCSNENLIIYVNGVALASQTFLSPGVVYNNDTHLAIGSGAPEMASKFFKGKIDEVLIYDRVLTSADINIIYRNLTVFPEIVQQPVAVTGCQGQSVTLSVVADNATRFQWFRNGTQIVGNDRITGVNTANLKIDALTPGDQATYNCRVGSEAATIGSNSVFLNYAADPNAIISLNGSNMVLNDVFDAYQWKRDGQMIDGANGQSYQATVGGYYTAEVSRGACTFVSRSLAYYPSPMVPPYGLLAYFPFTGNAVDSSGNEVVIKHVQAIPATDRNLEGNKAYNFRIAQGDHMQISLNNFPRLKLRENFSFAAWVKPEEGAQLYPTVLEFGDKLFLRLVMNNNNRVEVGFFNGTAYNTTGTANNVFTPGRWLHVAATVNDNMLTVYLNGESVVSKNIGAQRPVYAVADSVLAIGSGSPASQVKNFNGRIDEVSIYERALTANEVNMLWQLNTIMPTIVQQPTNKVICPGAEGTLSVVADNAVAYRWYRNNTQLHDGNSYAGTSSAELRFLNFSSNETGNYYCRVFSEAASVNSTLAMVGIAPSATPTVVSQGSDLTVQHFNAYQWVFNGSDLPGATAQSHTPVQDGIYRVRVTSDHNCDFLSAPFSHYTSVNVIPTYGLVAYYPLDNSVLDHSGNGHHAQAANVVPASDRNGVADAAYQFTANTQSRLGVNMDQHQQLRLSEQFTVSAWVQHQNAGSYLYPTVVEFGEAVFLRTIYQNGGHRIQAGFYDGAVYPMAMYNTMLASGWNHIAMTFNGSNITIYLNGTAVISAATTSRPVYEAKDSVFAIGGGGLRAGSKYMNGMLDNVAIYNRALTVQEINLLKDYTNVPEIITTIVERTQKGVMYPNPATDHIIVPGATACSIYDIRGEVLMRHSGSERVDVSALVPGIYFLEAHVDSGLRREKFIKR